MEVSSPQLAQAVAAARVALAEAFVLKVGQTLQAVVAGKAEGGLTLLRIGDQVVKAALPEALPTGTTLQLQVKSAGPAPQLTIVAQARPQPRAMPAVPGVESRPIVSTPPLSEGAATRPVALAQNIESRPTISVTSSQVESGPIAVPAPSAVPEPPPAVARKNLETPPAAAPPATATEPARAAVAAVVREAVPSIPGFGTQPEAARSAPGSGPGTPSPISTGGRENTTGPATPIVNAAMSRPDGEPAMPVLTPAGAQQMPAGAGEKPVPVAEAAPAGASPPAPVAEEPELAHPLLVAQTAPRPQVTLAELPRAIAAPIPAQPGSISLSPPPATPEAALTQMLPEALARQDSPAPLLQSLAALVQKPAVLPEPVLRAAFAVLAQRLVVTGGKVQAADLERAVQRSGLALEATLGKGETPTPTDAKAGLLALRAALTKWLGEGPTPPPPREPAPPPLRGLPLRAPEIETPPLPDAPRDALRAVHGQADAAVSRLKLMQMASFPDGQPGRPSQPALRLELPLMIGHELVMAQLQVSRDGARRETERKRGWTMRFALNFSATGEVGAEVGLLGKAVNVALWAAEPETADAMQDALPQLGMALEAIGLKPGALRIRQGVPHPEKPASGQLLDSVS